MRRLTHRPQPARCACMSGPDAPSTHRAPLHFGPCRHSTLRETTMARRPMKLRRLPGTRGVTVDLSGGWRPL